MYVGVMGLLGCTLKKKSDIISTRFRLINPKHTGSGQIWPPILISLFSQKFFPATYDKTLCKFLLWSKIISREHVEYIYIASVENVNFKICNFRVLRSILEQSFMKQKLFRIKKYKRKVTFVFWFEHFWSQKT